MFNSNINTKAKGPLCQSHRTVPNGIPLEHLRSAPPFGAISGPPRPVTMPIL